MASHPLTILADYRERPSGVVDALAELGVRVRVITLDVADYMVARGVGVERKTVSDLHRSILDRRLWSQIASLRVDLDGAYLVVEGRDIDRGPISPNGIRGVLLEVIALGVPVLRSTDVHDTASWLVRIAGRAASAGSARSQSRSSRRRRVTPTSILGAVPGISPRLAAALLNRYGCIAGVATAPAAELMTIPGIGVERATALRRLLADERV